MARPETLVREYRHSREYTRDKARLLRAGWEVVSVLERPAPPGRLSRALPSVRTQPNIERLVTYIWRGRERSVAVTSKAPPRIASRVPGHWWLLVVGVLVLLLALGVLSFLGDDVLPGLLLPMV